MKPALEMLRESPQLKIRRRKLPTVYSDGVSSQWRLEKRPVLSVNPNSILIKRVHTSTRSGMVAIPSEQKWAGGL